MVSKDKFENSNSGDFQNLYPLPRGVSEEQDRLMDVYDYLYLKVARDVYIESLTSVPIVR